MHFAGSNLSTEPKWPKCIYKISKNFRVEKSGEISAFSWFRARVHAPLAMMGAKSCPRSFGLSRHACKRVYVNQSTVILFDVTK